MYKAWLSVQVDCAALRLKRCRLGRTGAVSLAEAIAVVKSEVFLFFCATKKKIFKQRKNLQTSLLIANGYGQQ